MHDAEEQRCELFASLQLLLPAISIAGTAFPALAGPDGATVTHGTVTVDQAQQNYTQINQTTEKAIINWESFNIQKNEHTHFAQPSKTSHTLNRVTGSQQQASQILGKLTATGKVTLVNPNGVFIGKDAVVDTAGLIASTADIEDKDFIDGKLQFKHASPNKNAKIINKGQVTVKEAGLAAFVAPHVQNDGVITAKLGSVKLAGAETATIDLYGDGLLDIAVQDDTLNTIVENNGAIIAEGGTIHLTAASAKQLVQHGTSTETAQSFVLQNGQLVASNDTRKGGKVIATADVMNVTGTIDASGATGGGMVLIGGDFQGGRNPDIRFSDVPLPPAQTVKVAGGAVITANATHTGNGGNIVVWADDHTSFKGTVEAKGGVLQGDGGFVEVSGKKTLDFRDGTYDLTAPNGQMGDLLFDPATLTLNEGDLEGIAANTTFQADTLITISDNTNDDVFSIGAFDVTFETIVGGDIVTADTNDTIRTDGGALTFNALGGNLSLGTLDVTNAGANAAGNAISLSGDSVTLEGDILTGTSGSLLVESASGNISVNADINGLEGHSLLKSANNITVAGEITLSTAANKLSLLARGDINLQSTILSTGTGSGDISIVAGWDGITEAGASAATFNVSNITGSATSYGNDNDGVGANTGLIYIDAATANTEVDVGTKEGVLTTASAYLKLEGGTSSSDRANLGYYQSGGGSAYINTINIYATEDIDLITGTTTRAHSQIGNYSRFGTSGNGDINITAKNLTFTKATSGGRDAYAAIGHGGTNQQRDRDGNITINLSGDLVFNSMALTSPSDANKFLQIGHFHGTDQTSSVDMTGDITITANNITLEAATGSVHGNSIIGHGTGGSTENTGIRQGNITVTATGELSIIDNTGSGGSAAGIGHRTATLTDISNANVRILASSLDFADDVVDASSFDISDTNFISQMVDNLVGGDVTIGSTGTATLALSSPLATTTTNTFTLLSTDDLTIGDDITLTTGFFRGFAGWNGSTGLNANGSIDFSALRLANNNDKTLTIDAAGDDITATGTGDGIILAVDGDLINNSGTDALTVGGGGSDRYLLYVDDSTGNTLGGLSPSSVGEITYGDDISAFSGDYLFYEGFLGASVIDLATFTATGNVSLDFSANTFGVELINSNGTPVNEGLSISSGAGITYTSGSGTLTMVSGNNLAFNAVGAIDLSNLDIDMTSGGPAGGNITFNTDADLTLDANSLNAGTAGIVTFAPGVASDINIGTTTAGFDILQADFDAISNAAKVVVGDATNTTAITLNGAIDISSDTFGVDLLGNSIALNADFTASGTEDLTLDADSGAITWTTGTLTANDFDIDATGTIALGSITANGLVDVTNTVAGTGADIGLNGVISIADDLVIHSDGSLLDGASGFTISSTSAGADTTLRANGSILFDHASTNITNSGAGNGNIVLNSGRNGGGGAIRLSSTSIASNGGDITLGGGNAPSTTHASGVSNTLKHGIQISNAVVNAATGTITGYGQGYSAATNTELVNGVLVTDSQLTADSGIVLNGIGGVTTGVNNDNNNGILIQGTSTDLKTQNGDILLTGLAGSNSDHGVNRGVVINNGVDVHADGTGNITIVGTGTAGSPSNNNDGFNFNGSNTTRIYANSGDISITGTAVGSNGKGVLLLDNNGQIYSTTGALNITGTGLGASDLVSNISLGQGTSDDITLNVNTVELNGGSTIQSAGDITIAPRTATTAINLGTATGGLDLTQAELDTITAANKVIIGDTTNTGLLTVSSAIDLSSPAFDVDLIGDSVDFDDSLTLASTNDLTLITDTGGITQSSGTLTSEDLVINSAAAVGPPGPRINTDIDTLNIISSGNTFLTNASALTLMSVNVNGALNLRTGGTITVNGAVNTTTAAFNTNNGTRDFVLGASGSVTATGAGEALVIRANDFINNNASTTALNASGSGRYAVYTPGRAGNTLGNLLSGDGGSASEQIGVSFGDAVNGFTGDYFFYVAADGTIRLIPVDQTYTYNGSAQFSTAFTTAYQVHSGDVATLTADGYSVTDLNTSLSAGPGFNIDSTASGSVNKTDAFSPAKDITLTGTLTSSLGYTISLDNSTVGDYLINPKAITAITGITADNKVYDAITTAVLNTGSAAFTGIVGLDDLEVASSIGNFADVNVGTGKTVNITGLSLGGTDASNYTLSSTTASATADITARAITITADAGQTKVYGSSDPVSYTYSITTGALQGSDSFTGTLNRASGENVGGYAIQQNTLAISDGNSGSNYGLTYVADDFDITPAVLTINPTAQTYTYDGTDGQFNDTAYTLSGFQFSENAGTAGISGAGVVSAADKVNAGVRDITSAAGTLSASNYTFTGSTLSNGLTINRALLTLTPDAQTYTYDATDSQFNSIAYTLTGFQNGETTGTAAGFSGIGSVNAADKINAGTRDITGTVGTLAANNYSFTANNRVNGLTINQATLTFTSLDQNYSFNGTDSQFNQNTVGTAFSITGLQGLDTFAGQVTNNNTIVANASDKITATGGSPRAITLDISGASAANYILAKTESGQLTIDPAALTLTADNQSFVYGDNITATGFTSQVTAGGLISGDSLADVVGNDGVTYNIAGVSTGDNVGAYNNAISINGSSIDGTQASNYVVTLLNGDITITQAPLTLTPVAQTYTYNATDNQFDNTAYSLAGFRNGDTLVTAGISGAGVVTAADKINAGTRDITGAVGTLSSTNYSFIANNLASGLTINQASLLATAQNSTRLFGDPNPAFNIVYTGFQGADTSSVLDTLPTASTIAGLTSPVGQYAIDVNGGNDDNYAFAYQAGVLDVNPATVTLDVQDAVRVIGQTQPQYLVQAAGFKNGDTLASTVSGLQFNSPGIINDIAGSYTLAATGASAQNYQFVYQDGVLTVVANNNGSNSGPVVNSNPTINRAVASETARVNAAISNTQGFEGTTLLEPLTNSRQRIVIYQNGGINTKNLPVVPGFTLYDSERQLLQQHQSATTLWQWIQSLF